MPGLFKGPGTTEGGIGSFKAWIRLCPWINLHPGASREAPFWQERSPHVGLSEGKLMRTAHEVAADEGEAKDDDAGDGLRRLGVHAHRAQQQPKALRHLRTRQHPKESQVEG